MANYEDFELNLRVKNRENRKYGGINTRSCDTGIDTGDLL